MQHAAASKPIPYVQANVIRGATLLIQSAGDDSRACALARARVQFFHQTLSSQWSVISRFFKPWSFLSCLILKRDGRSYHQHTAEGPQPPLSVGPPCVTSRHRVSAHRRLLSPVLLWTIVGKSGDGSRNNLSQKQHCNLTRNPIPQYSSAGCWNLNALLQIILCVQNERESPLTFPHSKSLKVIIEKEKACKRNRRECGLVLERLE